MPGPLGTGIGAALADVRTLVTAELLPDTCQVERTTAVSDSAGGQTITTAIVASVACRLSSADRLGAEGPTPSRIVARSSYTVAMPLTTDLKANDIVLVNGRRFAVVSQPKKGGAWGLTLKAEAEERV